MARVPGPRGWPLTGSLYAIRRDLLGLLERSRERHGDLMRLRVGWVPVYIASHPDHARHVLLDRRDNYEKTSRSSREVRHIAGASLLTANGQEWADKRRLLQPAFKVGAVSAYQDVMVAATDAMLARWRRDYPRGGTLDLAHEMTHLTYRIVSEALLGEDLVGTTDSVDRALTFMLQHLVSRLQSLAPPFSWPTPGNLRFRRERQQLRDLVERVIARRRALPREPRDLLDAMIRAVDEQGAAFDQTWLRDEVTTLLLAGHETTANALNWTWHLLSQHPDAQAEASAEIDRQLAGQAPRADALTGLSYLRQVMFESMRLYPPIWFVERRAREADAIGGYAIPRGATLAVAIWLLHRHPGYWPDPKRFDPGRFRDSPPHGRPGFHYLPFGLGPRMCLGMNFAINEAMTVLARCLARLRVEPVAGAAPVVPLAGVTLRPRDGLPLRFHWRD